VLNCIRHDRVYFADWWTTSRKRLAKAERKCFDSLVILTSWMIWNERNRRTFDRRAKTVSQLVSSLEEEAASWVLALFRHSSLFTAACGRVIYTLEPMSLRPLLLNSSCIGYLFFFLLMKNVLRHSCEKKSIFR